MESYKLSDMVAERGYAAADEGDARTANYISGEGHAETTQTQVTLHRTVYGIVDRLLESTEFQRKVCETMEFGEKLPDIINQHVRREAEDVVRGMIKDNMSSNEYVEQIGEVTQNTSSAEMSRGPQHHH